MTIGHMRSCSGREGCAEMRGYQDDQYGPSTVEEWPCDGCGYSPDYPKDAKERGVVN